MRGLPERDVQRDRLELNTNRTSLRAARLQRSQHTSWVRRRDHVAQADRNRRSAISARLFPSTTGTGVGDCGRRCTSTSAGLPLPGLQPEGAVDAVAGQRKNFRPTTPLTTSIRQISRSALADSPSASMPTSAVPTAPMPTHTA